MSALFRGLLNRPQPQAPSIIRSMSFEVKFSCPVDPVTGEPVDSIESSFRAILTDANGNSVQPVNIRDIHLDEDLNPYLI